MPEDNKYTEVGPGTKRGLNLMLLSGRGCNFLFVCLSCLRIVVMLLKPSSTVCKHRFHNPVFLCNADASEPAMEYYTAQLHKNGATRTSGTHPEA